MHDFPKGSNNFHSPLPPWIFIITYFFASISALNIAVFWLLLGGGRIVGP